MGHAQRENLADRHGDHWRPPAIEPGQTPLTRLLARVRRFFDVQAGSIWQDVAADAHGWRGKVVDAGCGAQPYRRLLPEGTEYVGLDIDASEEAFGYKSPDTIYFDGGRWPEGTRDASVVLCTEVLEHVLEPPKLLSEAYAALRPGGRLLLTVPFAARWHFVPYDYWRFTPSSLKHLLAQAGFQNVLIRARGNEWTVACYKGLALLLPFFMPQGSSPAKTLGLRLLASPMIPWFFTLAAIANFSLSKAGGDDCLGYTVTADRPA